MKVGDVSVEVTIKYTISRNPRPEKRRHEMESHFNRKPGRARLRMCTAQILDPNGGNRRARTETRWRRGGSPDTYMLVALMLKTKRSFISTGLLALRGTRAHPTPRASRPPSTPVVIHCPRLLRRSEATALGNPLGSHKRPSARTASCNPPRGSS